MSSLRLSPGKEQIFSGFNQVTKKKFPDLLPKALIRSIYQKLEGVRAKAKSFTTI